MSPERTPLKAWSMVASVMVLGGMALGIWGHLRQGSDRFGFLIMSLGVFLRWFIDEVNEHRRSKA